MKLPSNGRRRVAALWVAEACLAAAAVLTLVRGGTPLQMVALATYLLLCAAAFALPGRLLVRGFAVLHLAADRRRDLLQLYLALAAAGVAAMLGTAHGWAAAVAGLLTGNALLTLEMEARAEARGEDG